MKSSIDFRREAEERALKIKRDKEAKDKEFSAFKAFQGQQQKPVFLDASAEGKDNATPSAARLAETDYQFNGGRARSNTGEFIPPRWVPDEETKFCYKCRSEFDWVNRRHHCRHCGHILCDACSNNKSLLPVAFGERDPQRVCDTCEEVLRPFQLQLTHTIANHQCANSIEIGGPCTRRYFNMPYANTLAAEVRKAAYTTHNMFTMDWIQDKSIPLQLLQSAKGLAYITVVKAGFGFAVRLGTGLVIARLADGSWSAPSAISTIGCNWGFLIGADVTDYMVILNTDEAVDAFSGTGQISVGAGVDVALGPLGRDVSGSITLGTNGFAPAYSYSHSRGMYVGVGLEGSLIMCRSSVNFNFYGKDMSPQAILRGEVPPPRAAQPLYDALYSAGGEAPSASYAETYSMTGSGDVSVGRPAAANSPVRTHNGAPLSAPVRAPTSQWTGSAAGASLPLLTHPTPKGKVSTTHGAGYFTAEDVARRAALPSAEQSRRDVQVLTGGML
jgi:lipid-binding SYLF domain-containing protein